MQILQFADWYKQNANTDQINNILQLWNSLTEELANVKDLEFKMRELCVDLMFRNHENDCSKTIDLGAGYRLRGIFKTNYNLNKDPSAINDIKNRLDTYGITGKQAAQAVIKYEPKFSKSDYDALPKEFRDIINVLLTTSPGAPQLLILKPGE